jgi:AraC-like DNA-binding protein
METEKPYLNPEFRLMDLRQVLPLNRSYLSALINSAYGCNFFQYVTNHRIQEAKRLIKEHPNMPMQDVAECCGFSSATLFSRIFARETGLTPKAWSNQEEA